VSARRKARKRALDVLFAADVRGADIAQVFAEETHREHPDPARFGDTDYATDLVNGVAEHLADIDSRLSAVTTDWPLSRLAAVDRTILRLASYEIVYRSDIPTAVAVSEAGELAQEYSTDESRSFVQGVLGALVKRHEAPPEL
jgi:N utilization substance protein B